MLAHLLTGICAVVAAVGISTAVATIVPLVLNFDIFWWLRR